MLKRLAASVQCTVTRLALAVHERFRTRPSSGPLRMRARSSARAQQQRSASSVLLAQLMLRSPPTLRRGARRLPERRRACACRWWCEPQAPSTTSCRPPLPPDAPPPEVASVRDFSGRDKLYVSVVASLIIPSAEKRQVIMQRVASNRLLMSVRVTDLRSAAPVRPRHAEVPRAPLPQQPAPSFPVAPSALRRRRRNASSVPPRSSWRSSRSSASSPAGLAETTGAVRRRGCGESAYVHRSKTHPWRSVPCL
jgi:hypothetical protein